MLSGIVLAAGSSTRMGRLKQLLPLGDRPLLQHVMDTAASSSRLDEIVLVLGHRAEEVREAISLPGGRPVRVVVNVDHAAGLSSSLRAGLRAVDAQVAAAGVLLGDQPRVPARLIDQVAEAWLAGRPAAARPVYRDRQGRRVPGHPVFLAREIWTQVDRLRGDEGARTLLSQLPGGVIEVPVEGDPPVDLDTWPDYTRAREQTSAPGNTPGSS